MISLFFLIYLARNHYNNKYKRIQNMSAAQIIQINRRIK